MQSPAPTAPATVEGLDLQWSAPARCSDSEAIELAVGRLLGDSDHHVAVVVEATTKHDGNADPAKAWTLQLSIATSGATEEHTLSTDQCAPLGDATALLIAVTIDPVAVARTIRGAMRRAPTT